MSSSSSDHRRIADRYARALFSLASEKKQLSVVKGDLDTVGAALTDGSAFSRLVNSPAIARNDQVKGMRAVLTQMKVSKMTQEFFRVLAENRRLAVTPFVVEQFADLVAQSRNETTADVTSAYPLSPAQLKELKQSIIKAMGRADVQLRTHEDPEILGGVVIRVDGKMFDNSISSKIERLATSMKAQVQTQ